MGTGFVGEFLCADDHSLNISGKLSVQIYLAFTTTAISSLSTLENNDQFDDLNFTSS